MAAGINNILTMLKWTDRLNDCEIIILHKGAPDDRKTITGSEVTELKKSYLTYEHKGKETFIPLHRVVEVRLEGKTIWKKKQP